MFGNFKEEARQILMEAKRQKNYLKHPFVGSEHLLLAILKNKNEVSDKLKEYHVTYDIFKDEILKTIGTGSENSNWFLYTPLLKRVIENAILDSRETNNGVVEITPAVYNVFKNNLIELDTNNSELISKGVVGMYDNFKVIMSNNMAKDETHVYCDVRSKTAIAFAGQINKVEAGRMEKRFSDYVRGLDTYGAKIIAEDEIQVVKIPV